MKQILVLLFALLSVISFATEGTAGPYHFDVHTDPSVVPVGRAKLIIKLTDSSGKPILNAKVKAFAQMPGMAMGERDEVAKPTGVPGTYAAPAVFGMAGAYGVAISIDGSLGIAKTTLTISTGTPTDTDQTASPAIWIVGCAGVVIIGLALILRQVNRTGQKVNLRNVFNWQSVSSVLLLATALVVAVWAINHYRRPGSMTPLEAQGMEMNAPAPSGTLPFHLATAESKPFAETVTYTGQAVGLSEEDVIARVSGAIIWMPYYVGDKVTKGQVLAKLDTTQIDPMVSEKSAQAAAASKGVGIAQSEYQRALAEVSQANAERVMREGEIAEAKAMITAAEQEEVSAKANLRMEEASVVDAKSQVAAAEADRNYWTQELGRTKQLFEQGAVSKDELQKAQASATSAIAKVRQANAGVGEATARVQAAQAGVSKAAAELLAAHNKLSTQQAEHHVHMAHVRSAEAAAESAKRRISQATSEVSMANAGLQGATTQRGYAELKSEVDGVITARTMSPGVVVSPGQSVLKVAQISPIRLQANMPEGDLARIVIGATMRVKRRDGLGTPLVLPVTSVSPSVDATSRMGVVEALYPNLDSRFKPGEFLSMEITIGSELPAVTVPTDAVQTDESGSYVWVAAADAAGQLTVSHVAVQLGGHAKDLVAIRSGLTAGQRVVLTPPQDLATGTAVTAPAAAEAVDNKSTTDNQTIEITAAGYSPQAINIPAGKAFKVTFIRRDDKTCGTEVIFPEIGIRRALPLNIPVVIDFPPQPLGRVLNFTCPMNMLNGKAVSK